MAATFPRHEFHTTAQRFLATVRAESPAVFCRATEQSFLRLATTPLLLARYDQIGRTNRDALAELLALRSRTDVGFRDEPPGTASLWYRLAARDTASPKVWMDSYLAAFAIRGGLNFVTLDRDFAAYESYGLKLRLLTASR